MWLRLSVLCALTTVWVLFLWWTFRTIQQEEDIFDDKYVPTPRPGIVLSKKIDPFTESLVESGPELVCSLYMYSTMSNLLSGVPDNGYIACDGNNYDSCRMACSKEGFDTPFLTFEGDVVDDLAWLAEKDLRIVPLPGMGRIYEGNIFNIRYDYALNKTVACILTEEAVVPCGKNCHDCSAFEECNRDTLLACRGTLLVRPKSTYYR